jgi:hyperosmotically inducible protein
MRRMVCLLSVVTLCAGFSAAADNEVGTFYSYVDTDICATLMLGPVNTSRVECSKDTQKQGSNPVVVRLEDNAVLEVNKQKMVKPLVGELAQVDGEVDLKKGRVKLQSVNQVQSSDIPEGSPARQLLDVRNFRANDAVVNRVRHELAMMPYISEFDFISFTMAGDRVILTGWTVRMTNRQTAYNLVKGVEGVGSITNNIQVLPMGASDMRVRATARARLGQFLSRYFWGSGSDIKIIVKNGNIILLGTVATEGDKNTANIQCNTVPGAFHVFNLLRVQKG